MLCSSKFLMRHALRFIWELHMESSFMGSQIFMVGHVAMPQEGYLHTCEYLEPAHGFDVCFQHHIASCGMPGLSFTYIFLLNQFRGCHFPAWLTLLAKLERGIREGQDMSRPSFLWVVRVAGSAVAAAKVLASASEANGLLVCFLFLSQICLCLL